MCPKPLFHLLFIACISLACEKHTSDPIIEEGDRLTVFFVNDQHGQLNNFAKVKHIVDLERARGNVLLLSAGDLFSGNPIVDQYSEKGYPMIDVMNQVEFDVSVLGNHEFDYGLETLEDRLQQSDFPWVCANMDVRSSGLSQPQPFITLQVGELNVTVLGLIETFGGTDRVIPATHPWRVQGLSFEHYYEMVSDYNDLKSLEGADLYIALTHLGTQNDQLIANDYPYFDLIIGGHSNDINRGEVNGIPTLMAGANLSHLGRVELTIVDQEVVDHNVSMIDLEQYEDMDSELMALIQSYNDAPEFEEVVGWANSHHNRTELGCFFTTALREQMDVDIAIQNSGGIRAEIDAGEITAMEIYRMDPFNNGSVVFTKTAGEIKSFLEETGVGLHVSGVSLTRVGDEIEMKDESGNTIGDDVSLTLGSNDYIPAVFESYFPFEEADVRSVTTVETILQYLDANPTVDFEGCDQFFRY